MNLEKDSSRQNREFIAQTLREAGATETHKRLIKCPFHDDHNPSATIRQAKSGFWYFYCYVCKIADDVWALKARISGRDVKEILKEEVPMNKTPVKGLLLAKNPAANEKSFGSFDELLSDWRQRNPNAELQEKNAYTDPATGRANYYTLRMIPAGETKKQFRQASCDESGRWRMKAPEGKLPLFNRVRVADCNTIIIFEGEKCVREFTKLGFDNIAGTTAPQGANGAGKADWQPLAGKKCIVWRDNDAPGEKNEKDVVEILQKLTPPCVVSRVRIEELGLEEKDDVVDYLDTIAGSIEEKRAALELVFQDSEPLNVTDALAQRLMQIASGAFRSIPFPQMPRLSELSKALMPGTVTTICGEPGAGKSFFMLEQFWRWCLADNANVKLLMLEDDDAFYQMRVLAQISGYADLTDVDYVSNNIDFANAVFDENRDHLEILFRNLETTKSEQKTLNEIADWIRIKAENGAEIIGVDPITAAKVSDKPYIDDQRFLFKVKEIVERTGARLILTTHPRLGQAGKPSLSGLAGGASYPRFSQTVLWLKNYEKPELSNIWANGASDQKLHKQTIEIRKARNGKGQGMNIAANLNFQNLCFDEIGLIDDRS